MPCPRCQHENRPPAKFCEECAAPLSPTTQSYADLTPEVALTQALTEALEQQTATAEILRVISRSPSDVQPVFEAIARNAVRVCDAVYCAVFQVDGDRIDLVAHHNIPPEGLEELRRHYPAPLSVDTRSAQAARERVVVQINDVKGDLGTTEYGRRLAMVVGYRSLAFVPMLREPACSRRPWPGRRRASLIRKSISRCAQRRRAWRSAMIDDLLWGRADRHGHHDDGRWRSGHR
jgi:hypothetical protein